MGFNLDDGCSLGSGMVRHQTRVVTMMVVTPFGRFRALLTICRLDALQSVQNALMYQFYRRRIIRRSNLICSPILAGYYCLLQKQHSFIRVKGFIELVLKYTQQNSYSISLVTVCNCQQHGDSAAICSVVTVFSR